MAAHCLYLCVCVCVQDDDANDDVASYGDESDDDASDGDANDGDGSDDEDDSTGGAGGSGSGSGAGASADPAPRGRSPGRGGRGSRGGGRSASRGRSPGRGGRSASAPGGKGKRAQSAPPSRSRMDIGVTQTKAQLKQRRKTLEKLSSTDLQARVAQGADMLALCSLLRLAGYLMRPFDVAMPPPFDKGNLPNLFPDLDSLSVEFSSVVGKRLVKEWIEDDHLDPSRVQRNAVAIGLTVPFWRVGCLLELDRMGYLRNIHKINLSETGELCALLKQWHSEKKLTRTRNQAAAAMSPTTMLQGMRFALNNDVPQGDALLAHLKSPTRIGDLNVDVILRDIYHFCDSARSCTDAYVFADGGCAAFHSEVLDVHPDQWEDAVALAQTEIPASVQRLQNTFPAFFAQLPPDAVRMLGLKLLKTTAENHCCEGLKMIKALLFAEMANTPWRGLQPKKPKLPFSLSERNKVWKPPTDRPVEVAVDGDGSVMLANFTLSLKDQQHASRLRGECDALKAELLQLLKVYGGGPNVAGAPDLFASSDDD